MAINHDLLVVDTTSSSEDDAPRRLLKGLIISGLQQNQGFGRVAGNRGANGASAGLMVIANIKEYYGVSDTARMLVGGLAGQARILVEVTVSDLSSGQQIESFEVVGKSSGGSVMAGTGDQAVQRAAEQVVVEVDKLGGAGRFQF